MSFPAAIFGKISEILTMKKKNEDTEKQLRLPENTGSL